MAGRYMFEDCLTADIHDSLRGKTSGWCVDAFGHRLARLVVNVDAKNRGAMDSASSENYWLSGDNLGGKVLLESAQQISITRARIRLEGTCRMYTRILDSDGRFQRIPKLFAYKFLSQTHQLEPEDFLITETNNSNILTASVPFSFTISHTALSKTPDVPQQCLQLPPTMTVGAILQEENSDYSYAQPSISYSLVAELELRSTNDHQTTITGLKGIPVWAFSAPNPPIDTQGFPGEYVEAVYHPCRPSRLRKETFLLMVSAAEPPAVLLPNRRTPGTTSCKVIVTVKDTDLGTDIYRLSKVSQNIRLTITPALRVKTFYSPRSFRKIPSQSMLTANGPVRLHDEVRTFSSACYSNLSWQTSGTSAHDQQAEAFVGGAEISAVVSVMVQIPTGIPPSFCSAVVSRQYSLIIQCKVKGVHVDSFGLEVPLQIVYGTSKGRQVCHNIIPGASLISDSGEGCLSRQRVYNSGVESPGNSTLQQESRPLPPDYDP